DAGGIPVPEAPGLEAVLAGLQTLHADDDVLAAAAGAVFDALYATAGAAKSQRSKAGAAGPTAETGTKNGMEDRR
ncbi:MAG: chromate resistance protein, partial [Rubrivivax sp.]|nr:chromate resistance protein [Rubrivivax sp.]